MSYKLYLDDERPCPEGWELATGFWEFKRIVNEKGVPDEVSFDFYLSDRYTGLDCAQYLMMVCQEKQVNFPKFWTHTASMLGGRAIRDFVREFS